MSRYNPAVNEGKRLYRLLSSYLNTEWERIKGVIDEYDGGDPGAATAELDAAMGRPQQPSPPAYEPPPQAPPPYNPPVQTPQGPAHHSFTPEYGTAQQKPKPPASPLEQYYAILGVQIGADFALVRVAYQRLARRAEPARFEPGSEAAQQAEAIRKKVDEAYAALRRALDPSAARFSELDLS